MHNEQWHTYILPPLQRSIRTWFNEKDVRNKHESVMCSQRTYMTGFDKAEQLIEKLLKEEERDLVEEVSALVTPLCPSVPIIHRRMKVAPISMTDAYVNGKIKWGTIRFLRSFGLYLHGYYGNLLDSWNCVVPMPPPGHPMCYTNDLQNAEIVQSMATVNTPDVRRSHIPNLKITPKKLKLAIALVKRKLGIYPTNRNLKWKTIHDSSNRPGVLVDKQSKCSFSSY